MNPLTNFEQFVEVAEKPDKSGLIAPPQKNPVLDFADFKDPNEWTGSVGYQPPRITSAKEPSVWDKIKNSVTKFTKESPEASTARAQNIESISKVTGMQAHDVEKHYNDLRKMSDITGIDYSPNAIETTKKALQAGMTGMVAAGLATSTVPTAAGLLVFSGLDHLVKLDNFVPPDANDTFRSTVELGDFAVKALVAHQVFESLPELPSNKALIKNTFGKWFKAKAVEKGIPDVLTLSADKLTAIKQKLSPDEFKDFMSSLGLKPGHDDAAGEGVDIQFPTEKLFESMVSDIASKKDVSNIEEKELPAQAKTGEAVEVPASKPRRYRANLQRAIDNGSVWGVINNLGGFSVKEEQGELGHGAQRAATIRRMVGIYRKDAAGADEVLQEAKGLAPHIFNQFNSGTDLVDYFKNRTPGQDNEYRVFDSYQKERSDEYEREIQALSRQAIESGISPETLRALIERRVQEGTSRGHEELDSGTVPEELKEADTTFDFGANVKDEKQQTITGTESKFPDQGILPTDKNLIQEQGELFDPDKKYSIASVFYSALERAVDQKMPTSATVSQVKGIIESSGIPKDQLDWIDLEGFFKEQERKAPIDAKELMRLNPSVKTIEQANKILKDYETQPKASLPGFAGGPLKISKQALLDFIRQNDVKVEEVVKGQEDRVLTPEETSRLEELTKRNEKKPLGAIDDDESGSWNELLTLENIRDKSTSVELLAKQKEYEKLARQFQQKGDKKQADKYWERANHYTARHEEFELSKPGEGGLKDTTKFSQYQLPGGENYKELLLTLPEMKANRSTQVQALIDEREALYEKWKSEGTNIVDIQAGPRKAEADRFYELNGLIQSADPSYFNQGHAAPNFNSSHFDEPNVLAHIRFNDRTDPQGKKILFIEEVQSDWHQKGQKEGYLSNPLSPAEEKRLSDLTLKIEPSAAEEAERQALSLRLNKSIDGVPNAPFKKTWHELALKRMLRYAAENGYDKIAWTTGEQQAERYDLSKQIDYVSWNQKTHELNADKGEQSVIADQVVAPEKLEDYVGKEVSKKLQEGNASQAGVIKLSGLDLKVGGEGMKVFYDQIIPSFLNKYTKKWGGRVGKTELPRINESGTHEKLMDKTTVHSLEITPSMKQSVLYEGQRYSVGQPKNQAEQLRVIADGRKLFEKLGHSKNQLVIEANLKTDQGENALGWFMRQAYDRGLTKIDPRTGIATYHHEMGHGILNLAYTGEERQEIFREVRENWGAIDDRAAEEMIMDQAYNAYQWVASGKDIDSFLNQTTQKTFSEKVKGFILGFIDNIKSFMGFASDESNMKNLKKFYEDLYSGARKEISASDKEAFKRYSKEKDPEIQAAILRSKPYYEKIKGLLSDRESGFDEPIPERFQNRASEPLGSQITQAASAFKSGGQELIESVNKVFNPATAAKAAAGEGPYAEVMRAIHTPDAEMLGFNNARSAIFDLNFQEIEKLFNRLSKKEVQNFNLIRGQAEDPAAMMLQEEAQKEIQKSFKPTQVKNLVDTVKEISDYVYKYIQENGIELNYFKDYFYGAYKDPSRANKFIEYWRSTDRFQKEKVFPTIADAQAFGLELRDPNPVTNLRAEMRAAALKAGLLKLRNSIEKDKTNTYAAKMEDLTPDQKRRWKAVEDPTFDGLRFHPDFADMVNSLMSTNKVTNNMALGALRTTAAIAQNIKFLGSDFHLVGISKSVLADQAFSLFDLKGYKEVGQAFGKGIDTIPEYKEYVNLGGGHHGSIESQAQQQLYNFMNKFPVGRTIAKAADFLDPKTKWLPLSPAHTKWIFDEFIPAVQFNRFMLEGQRLQDKLGRPLSDVEKINIIRTNQNIYGEMNERLFGRSGTVTSALRLIYLSPGFAEGNYRSLFMSIKDLGKIATGKPISEAGQRNLRFVASSLFSTFTIASIGTFLMTGQAPPAPKKGSDLRDLFKMRTGIKDGNGDELLVDVMMHDADYFHFYGNLLSGQPGKILAELPRRQAGMVAPLFHVALDLANLGSGGMVYDYRGLPLFYKTDDFHEKLSKFMAYEAERGGSISLSSFAQATRSGISAPAAAAGAIIGVRTTTTEDVKEIKNARNDIFALEDAKRGKVLDLNKLYKENPDRALGEAKKFNEGQVKKIVQILKKVGYTEAPPRKFFDDFIIKNLKQGGSVAEGTVLESLFEKKKRKAGKKVMSEDDKRALDEFISENFNK